MNQFLTLANSEDVEAILAELDSPELEVVTSDLGAMEVTASAKSEYESEQFIRKLDIKVTIHDVEQAIKWMKEEDSIIENDDLSDLDYMQFARYYLGDWEGVYLDDEMYDFDNDLLSGEVVDL